MLASQWQSTLETYERWRTSRHFLEVMYALVVRLSQIEPANALWPSTSHEKLLLHSRPCTWSVLPTVFIVPGAKGFEIGFCADEEEPERFEEIELDVERAFEVACSCIAELLALEAAIDTRGYYLKCDIREICLRRAFAGDPELSVNIDDAGTIRVCSGGRDDSLPANLDAFYAALSVLPSEWSVVTPSVAADLSLEIAFRNGTRLRHRFLLAQAMESVGELVEVVLWRTRFRDKIALFLT
jgi:hypothetical protein